MTSSRAGIPLGKIAFRSASRSIAPFASTVIPRGLVRLAAATLDRIVRLVVAALDRVVVEADGAEPCRILRLLFACADLPATPCARLRWAPSAAARVNFRPHSGHVNSTVSVVACFVVAVLFAAPRLDALGCVLALGTFLTSWLVISAEHRQKHT
jgi:hypothetical protein